MAQARWFGASTASWFLAAATFAVFSPACQNGFVNYDDELYVTGNAHVYTGLSSTNLIWAMTSTEVANWHPLTWLSLQLDASIHGRNPQGFHLTNIALHAANAGLLLRLLFSMTGRLGPSLAASVLFAWHPLRVESVAWIAERKDVLGCFFWILTMQIYVRWVARPLVAGRCLIVACFALGLMAKPMLVTLPVVLILVDFWPLERFRRTASQSTSADSSSETTWAQALREKLPLFILSVTSSIITVHAQQGAILDTGQCPLCIRIANAVLSYARYVEMLIWPVGLQPFYPYPSPDGFAARVAAATLVLAFIIAIAWRQRFSRPYLLFGWLWYFVTLLPVIGIVQVGLQSRADRYTYIPSIGLAVMISWSAFEVLQSTATWRRPAIVALMALVLFCAFLTMRQLSRWRDSERLWRYAIDVDPANFMAHYLLGLALAARAEGTSLGAAPDSRLLAQAVAEYRESIRLKDDQPEPYYALGRALAASGDLVGAADGYEHAIRSNPRYADAYNNLGAVEVQQGNIDQAIQHYHRALELKPSLNEASVNLRRLLEWRDMHRNH